MTIQRPALAVRASLIATITAVLIAATVLAGRAEAAAPVIAQGAGMGAKPSADVTQVQQALQRRGYDLGAPGVDGRFGPLTAAAVRRLQAARGLTVDGVVGKRTRAALRRNRQAAPAAQPRRRPKRVLTATLTQASTTTQPGPASNPAPPRAATDTAADTGSSSIGTVVLVSALIAGLAALALGGLRRSRKRSRRKAPDPDTAAAVDRPAVVPVNATTQVAAKGATNGTAGISADASMNETTATSANGTGHGRFSRPPAAPRERMIGYLSTSSGAWSEADERAAASIEATCEGSNWDLLEIVCDRETGQTVDRPGLKFALEQIAEGRAQGLVIRDLRRLSRSTDELGRLMAWLRAADATLVALDLGLDTSTPGGSQVASTLIALGAANDQRRSEPIPNGSAPRANARPAVKDRPELMERIAKMRSANLSLQQIADRLNAENVPTLRGGAQWRPSSIQAALGYRRPGPRDRSPALQDRGGEGG